MAEVDPPELVAVTVYADVPMMVGVPEITPVTVLKESPEVNIGEILYDVTLPETVGAILVELPKVRILGDG